MGTKISDGLPPVPTRLVTKIRQGEFVELHEFLPECLAESDRSGKPVSRAKAKKRLDDLDVWLQCFALYVAVLAPTKPALVPDLMAYMISIITASQEYEASAWVAYDDAYRRQAAAAGNQWQWSQVNPSLYAVCFTGKAKRTGRCERCLSAAHKTKDCSLPNEDDTDIAKRLKPLRQRSWLSPRLAPLAHPEGPLASCAGTSTGGSVLSVSASTGIAVLRVRENIQQ